MKNKLLLFIDIVFFVLLHFKDKPLNVLCIYMLIYFEVNPNFDMMFVFITILCLNSNKL